MKIIRKFVFVLNALLMAIKYFLKIYWWKIMAIILIVYAVVYGLSIDVPELPNIRQSIRNLFFHVGMWFAMIALMSASMCSSIKYLTKQNDDFDTKASSYGIVGLFFGLLGILTGMIWAKNTWGDWWINDPKLNGALIAILSYFSYFVLRNSFKNFRQKARFSAVYNIFAYFIMVFFMLVIPKLSNNSIHPESSGNNSFVFTNLDYKLRLVFFPAMLGWILLAFWIAQLKSRIDLLALKLKQNHV